MISTAIESQRKQHSTRGIDAGTYVASVAVKALQQRTAALRYIHRCVRANQFQTMDITFFLISIRRLTQYTLGSPTGLPASDPTLS